MGEKKKAKKENKEAKEKQNEAKPTIEIDLAEEKPKKDFIKIRETKK